MTGTQKAIAEAWEKINAWQQRPTIAGVDAISAALRNIAEAAAPPPVTPAMIEAARWKDDPKVLAAETHFWDVLNDAAANRVPPDRTESPNDALWLLLDVVAALVAAPSPTPELEYAPSRWRWQQVSDVLDEAITRWPDRTNTDCHLILTADLKRLRELVAAALLPTTDLTASRPRMEGTPPEQLKEWARFLANEAGNEAVEFGKEPDFRLRAKRQERERMFDAIHYYLHACAALSHAEAPRSEEVPAREQFDAIMASVPVPACVHGVPHVREDACPDCAASSESDPLNVLNFCEGAIRDAIGLEDGLDGFAGEAVLAMIRDARARTASHAEAGAGRPDAPAGAVWSCAEHGTHGGKRCCDEATSYDYDYASIANPVHDHSIIRSPVAPGPTREQVAEAIHHALGWDGLNLWRQHDAGHPDVKQCLAAADAVLKLFGNGSA